LQIFFVPDNEKDTLDIPNMQEGKIVVKPISYDNTSLSKRMSLAPLLSAVFPLVILIYAVKLPSKSRSVCILMTALAVLYYAQSNRLNQRLVVVESIISILLLVLNFTCLNLACCPKRFANSK
jgi:hypothetical protein